MPSSVIYPCETLEDERRVVGSTLFQYLRWMYWDELADHLRYSGITAEGIDRALFALLAEGRAERGTSYSGRHIYRIAFPTTNH